MVLSQIMRRFWLVALLEVRGRSYDYLLEVRPDTHSDHVLRNLLAKADASIKAIGRNVGDSIEIGWRNEDMRVFR